MAGRGGVGRGRVIRYEPDLLLAYSLGKPAADAARETGHALRTVERRFADDGFCREGDRLRSRYLFRAVGEAASRSATLATRAVEELGRLMEHSSPWVRLNASRGLLEVLVRLRADVDFAARLDALEERLARYGSAR